MSTPPSPAPEVSPAELAAARAVARRTGRTVFAVCDAAGGTPAPGAPPQPPPRRLSFDRPDDPSGLAYWVDRTGAVRFGPAARPPAATAGRALVRDPSQIPARELAAARDYALIMGRTVFVAEVGEDPEASAMHFDPPIDGTLRYAVRAGGELLVGAAAGAEPARAVADPGWTARVSAHLRQLRRLRERAAELAPLALVGPQDWARVERLIPPDERAELRPGVWIGTRGADAAAALLAAADREVERLRHEAGRLSG